MLGYLQNFRCAVPGSATTVATPCIFGGHTTGDGVKKAQYIFGGDRIGDGVKNHTVQ